MAHRPGRCFVVFRWRCFQISQTTRVFIFTTSSQTAWRRRDGRGEKQEQHYDIFIPNKACQYIKLLLSFFFKSVSTSDYFDCRNDLICHLFITVNLVSQHSTRENVVLSQFGPQNYDNTTFYLVYSFTLPCNQVMWLSSYYQKWIFCEKHKILRKHLHLCAFWWHF